MRASPCLLSLTLAACGPAADGDTGTSEPDVAAAVGCGPEADVGLEVGQCAPDFTLPDGTGASFTLSSMRGKVALVDISAVW